MNSDELSLNMDGCIMNYLGVIQIKRILKTWINLR
jgi:hypothetical protein